MYCWLNDMTQLICLKRLWILFLQPQQYSYPSIFIYGHRASGKSHVMQVLLKELEVRERFAVIAESLEAKWCLTDLKQMLWFLKESFVLGNIAFYLKFTELRIAAWFFNKLCTQSFLFALEMCGLTFVYILDLTFITCLNMN